MSVGPVLRSCQQQRFDVIGSQSGPVLAHPNCWNHCLMSSPNLPFHNYSPSLCSCPLWHGEEIIPRCLSTAVLCVEGGYLVLPLLLCNEPSSLCCSPSSAPHTAPVDVLCPPPWWNLGHVGCSAPSLISVELDAGLVLCISQRGSSFCSSIRWLLTFAYGGWRSEHNTEGLFSASPLSQPLVTH